MERLLQTILGKRSRDVAHDIRWMLIREKRLAMGARNRELCKELHANVKRWDDTTVLLTLCHGIQCTREHVPMLRMWPTIWTWIKDVITIDGLLKRRPDCCEPGTPRADSHKHLIAAPQ